MLRLDLPVLFSRSGPNPVFLWLQAIFSQCGSIKDAWTLPSSNSDTAVIRVKFNERDGMLKAIKQFDGQVADGRTLSVKEVGSTRPKDLIDESMEEDNEASGSKG